MNGHTTHPAIVAEWPPETQESPDPVCRDLAMLMGANNAPSSRTDAERLRDIAAVLRHEAAALAAILPTGQTDVRADIALLRMVADNIDGYATTREAA